MSSISLLLLASSSLYALSVPVESEQPVRKCALLVGINDYGPSATPEVQARNQWPALKGARNDVKAMAEVLRERYGFEVAMLLDKDATRAGIRQAFKSRLMHCVRNKRDVALFHFSGHGQQIDDPDGDEPDGADESIVPFDNRGTRNSSANIRDDEFEGWLAQLRERSDNVVVSMDSCHSGDATRSGSRARGIAHARSLVRIQTEQAPGGWTDAALDYVFLAASDSDERAYESRANACADNEEECTMGRFTRALVKELWTASPRLTYLELIARVRHEMRETNRGHHPHQSPQVVGQRERRLFSTDSAADRLQSYVVSQAKGRAEVAVEAGLIHGLSVGSVIAVYKSDADIVAKAPVLARFRVERIGATRAWGQALDVSEQGINLEMPLRGVEEFSAGGGLLVRLDTPVQGLATLLAEKSHMTLVSTSSSQVDAWNVRVYGVGDVLRLETYDGVAIGFPTSRRDKRFMETSLSKTAPNAAARIASALESFFRRNRLMSLANRRADTHLHVTMRLSRSAPHQEPDLSEPGDVPTFSIARGDTAKVLVENWENQKVYLTLLEISPTGLINVLVPSRGEADAWVSKPPQPGFRELPQPQRKVLLGPARPNPPYGTYTLKLIASTSPLNLASLAFGVSDTGEHDVTRGGAPCGNTLECLLTTKATRQKTRGGHQGVTHWVTQAIDFSIVD